MLVVAGAPEQDGPTLTEAEALALVQRYRSEGRSLKEACKLAAADSGYGKNELYEMTLQIPREEP